MRSLAPAGAPAASCIAAAGRARARTRAGPGACASLGASSCRRVQLRARAILAAAAVGSGPAGHPDEGGNQSFDALVDAVRAFKEGETEEAEEEQPLKPTALSELEEQVAAAGEVPGSAYTLEEAVAQLSRALAVSEDLMPSLLRLPSTAGGFANLQAAAKGMQAWRQALSVGLLPPEAIAWPADAVFRTALLGTMADLDMAKFTRRHPALLNVLLRNVMEVLARYEQERKEVPGPDAAEGQQTDSGQKQKQEGGEKQQNTGSGSGENDGQAQQEAAEGSAQSAQGSGGGGGGEQQVRDAQFELSSDPAAAAQQAARQAAREAAEAANAAMAAELAAQLRREWEPLVNNLARAEEAFDGFDLDDLADEAGTFDLSRGVWREGTWRVLDTLRRKLESLRELRDLVRNLGRASGRGPLRRAPRQTERRGKPLGIVRTDESPEETHSLARSGDIGRMLPSEAQLLAAARPRNGSPGLPAARLLHLSRRAERTLLSYERVGWTDTPAQTRTGMEVRPAAECGPIILCLDTSGSMMGARETVAKALTFECTRQARTQQRACFLYAFSGPGDCVEFELSVNARGLSNLLQFLSGSFHGGTDVDEPFKRSLERLKQAEWSNADILLVTDGEIPQPSPELVADVARCREEMGLKVHAVLVGETSNPAVESLCSHTHTFRSWSAVKG